MGTLPVITAEDVAGRLDWVRMADAIAEGHRGPTPHLGDQFLTEGTDVMLSRAAWIPGIGVGVKSVTVFPGNPAKGRPTVQGAMLVFDPRMGAPLAVIDNALITYWKTAADSVLGARLLARPDARRLFIIGAGTVARSLIEAYPAVLPQLNDIAIWNRSAERAEALRDATGVRVATDLAEAVAEADIVATATLSKTPVLKGTWLRAGTHVDLIGAFTADMREADDATLTRGTLFVDCRETTLGHIGEVTIPMEAGVITPEDIRGDLRALISGETGRRDAAEITVFKNGGGAHLDLMVAREILTAYGAPG